MSKEIKYFHSNFKGIEIEELNKILKKLSKTRTVIFRERRRDEEIGGNLFIDDSPTKITFEYRDAECKLVDNRLRWKYSTYRFVIDKDGNRISETTPLNASSQFGKIYHVEHTDTLYGIKPCDIVTETPLIWMNKKFRGKSVVAYEYDMSAAYLQMLKLPIPNQYTMRRDAKLGKGQLGFIEYNGELQFVEDEGRYCDYVFDSMPSPYIKKAEKLEEKIAKEQDKNKKNDLKNVYRYVVGCWRNTNPFIRGCIIGRCNNLVRSLIDSETTIYCNTDSLVSTVKRPDILNSNFIWKLKHDGDKGDVFKASNKTQYDYQWNLETPTQRGLVKRFVEYYNKTHKEPWDILKDAIPKDMETLYVLNRETLQVEENTKWQKVLLS